SEKFNWLKQTMPAQPSGPITRPAITTRREQKETSQERIIAYLKGVYLKRPIIPAGNGRSRELFFLGLDCHAWGIDLDAAIALGREITQARHAPPEDDKIVKHQITSAYRYRRGEFGDIRERVEGATEKQQLKELKKYEIISKARVELADWVYCHDAVRLIDRATGRVLTSRDQMTSFIASVLGQRIDLDELLAAQAIETVDRIDYAPDIPDQVFERDGLKYYNSYRPGPRGPKPDRKTAKRAVQMFKQHIKYITTSEKE
ncbi:MAG: hypothetical protein RML34_11705, partial [Leptospiraceae bacterium]|nr:hypothetical protein [Leptospiraceae bacterium]